MTAHDPRVTLTEADRTAEAQAAWLAYRDQTARERPWADRKRLARQMRRRDFIAGYLVADAGREELLVRFERLADEMDAAYRNRPRANVDWQGGYVGILKRLVLLTEEARRG